MTVGELSFREGTSADLSETFFLSERAVHEAGVRQGVIPGDQPFSEEEMRAGWGKTRPLIEFLAAQPEGRYWLCENGEGLAGFARVAQFGAMEQLTELMVDPAHQGRGVGRSLLERCWPGDPTPELGRIVVANGAPRDLSLYTAFGVMPVTGHWHLQHRTEQYLERRAQEIDTTEPGVHVLEPARAVTEWQRLEPPAIQHERPHLHEFFGRGRTCLAVMDGEGRARSLCWVSGENEIGPAVAATSEELVPVVLAALDRVAKIQEPERLRIFSTTISWWLLRRLRGLGFRVYWPSWIMCSVPLPGLDRYMPTRPPQVL